MPTTGVRRVASLSAAIASDLGNVRLENQDRAAISHGWDRHGREYALVAVADGIGGMQNGGTCAAMTVSVFIAAVDQCAQDTGNSSDHSEDWLRESVHAANQAVFTKFRAIGGSTLVALLLRPGSPPYWLSVGDSRVYCIEEKALTQISIDDTIAGQLGKGPAEAFEQSRLLQFVGMGADLEPHIDKLDPGTAGAVLLTTDGVHYLAASPGWLDHIVHHAPDPGVCVKRLVDLAKWCGGPDNATVAMITLPLAMQSEPQPSYPCLEVWDAYGELQIVSPVLAKEHSNLLGGSVTTSRTRVPNTPSAPLLEPAIDEHSGPHVPEQSKSRRGKAPRKPKKSADKQSKNPDRLTEAELPQLHMEFPTKSS
ncbi:MAG: serine/threonine-protein phosphatase [Sulfuritalea sp.]|nr:serine/threonine-protein phosphatase [Sulfuritalea sp.]